MAQFHDTEQKLMQIGDNKHAKDTKAELRLALEQLPPAPEPVRAAVVDNVGKWIEEHRPRTVVGFLAMESEIDFTPLVDRFPEVRFGLTRTAPGVTLTVHEFDGPRERHRFGFEQPAADSPKIPIAEIDVVLVPGVAFGPDGRRLGHGAGYYDRFLATVDATKIGLTTDNRVRPDLPLEPHDVLVDWIATESGVVSAVRG